MPYDQTLLETAVSNAIERRRLSFLSKLTEDTQKGINSLSDLAISVVPVPLSMLQDPATGGTPIPLSMLQDPATGGVPEELCKNL